ncbi:MULTISPECIES: glutathione peroxidase [unclassified Frankia]|uniref:glutathione peroxidase n=1 Tax=unclassified Frankia TaxID=2632575 RepID=UPI001EF644D1|nr:MULTISPECIES: glutathione peroxidase [unclassified Frankia]
MTIYDFTVTTSNGETRSLGDYAGRTLLIVNVASACGLTPQYEELETLYRDTHDRGLDILGFPCNQFGGQEPGTDAEIQQFCSTQYNITFPIFRKIDVNGPAADPLFVYLRAQAPGDFGPSAGSLYEHIKAARPETIGTDEVKWNFTKFLVGRDGAVIRRYEPAIVPREIHADVQAELSR